MQWTWTNMATHQTKYQRNLIEKVNVAILDKEKVVVLFMLLKLFLLLFSLCNCDSKRRSRKMNRCRVHSFKSFRVLQTRLLFGDEMVRYSKVYGKKKSEKNCNESITGIHQTLCNRLDEDTMGTLLGE